MIKIIETFPEKRSIISGRELAGAILADGPYQHVDQNEPVLDDHQYLLGTPHFDLNFKKDTHQFIPLGQYKPALTIFRKTLGKSAMKEGLRAEYRSIVKALFKMGIKFRVVDLERGDRDVGRWLRERGCADLRLPYDQITHWQIFPRDMWVYLKKANIILAHTKLFKIPQRSLKGCMIIHTKSGEGGRVLSSGYHMIMGVNPEAGRRVQDKAILRIKDMGVKTAFLPYALFYGLSTRGERKFLFHHSHIDLIGSLIKGKDGGLHLIIDPEYRTGPLSDPLSVKASLDLARRNCAEIETEVHVPRKALTIPFSTAMVQFENGKVLATRGDDGVLAILSDIVGLENMQVTDIPILQYPVFGGAGLHCLITENPLPIISV